MVRVAVLTDTQLEALLAAESDRVERKRSSSDRDRIREAICAFANDLPGHGEAGVIVIGIEDDGSCAGLTIDDALLQRLAQMRAEVQPNPTMAVEKRVLGGCEVAVVIVEPSHHLPVRYNGRIWIRVGPTRGVASPDDERRLIERRQAFDLSFDAREAAPASLAALDLAYVRDEYLPAAIAPEVLAQNHRPIEHQLRSIHFLGPNNVPTYAGLLTAGVDPLDQLPGAYIQFVRFEGTELTDPVGDEKKISGRLADVLRRTEELLEGRISVGVSFTDARIEHRRPAYPMAALQQLVRNAVMHRNYEGTHAPVRVYWFDDRIEILSPGGPYGHVNRTNFGTPPATDYRNPRLAHAMHHLGFVQRFGVGIATARREMEKNGNPEPEFDVQPTAVLAVLRRRP